ncbi:MAG TPA: lycopene cyclase family protein, partial [Myxococcota bacterium]|nr:lycopene cyclase family protein [Myxococcota bacterium]
VAERGPKATFGRDFDALATEQEQQSRFAYLLNELLFEAADPDLRWKVFRHFYALPDELVLRFYGLTLSASDKR